MATDGMPGKDAAAGNNIMLTIRLTDEREQTRIFDALSRGGEVTQPLEDTFWGSRFGMLVDRYGIHWMLDCAKRNS